MALAGEQSRFGAGQHALGLSGEGGQQRLNAFPGLRRNVESQIHCYWMEVHFFELTAY